MEPNPDTSQTSHQPSWCVQLNKDLKFEKMQEKVAAIAASSVPFVISVFEKRVQLFLLNISKYISGFSFVVLALFLLHYVMVIIYFDARIKLWFHRFSSSICASGLPLQHESFVMKSWNYIMLHPWVSSAYCHAFIKRILSCIGIGKGCIPIPNINPSTVIFNSLYFYFHIFNSLTSPISIR